MDDLQNSRSEMSEIKWVLTYQNLKMRSRGFQKYLAATKNQRDRPSNIKVQVSGYTPTLLKLSLNQQQRMEDETS